MTSRRAQKDMNNEDFLYKDLTYKIRGAIFTVWKEFGPVFKEVVYQRALAIEFLERGIPFESEKQIDITYNNKKVGIYRPDFVIDEKIIIEIKHVPYLTKADEKQLWYYLKNTSYKLAFLVNFGGRELEIRRWIYDKARQKYSA